MCLECRLVLTRHTFINRTEATAHRTGVSVNKKVLSSEELRHSTNAGNRGIFFKIPNGKESFCQCKRHKRHRFDLCVGKIPWRRAWQPTPIFLLGESHRGAWLATPRCPFIIKSLALLAHVSPRTIHFQVLDKSPVSGPGRGPPSYNKLIWGNNGG